MIKDKDIILASEQAVTVTAATTNYIDTQVIGAPRDGMFIEFAVTEAVTAAGAATLIAQVRTDGDPAFGSPVVLYASPVAIPKADLVIGKKIKVPFPIQDLERYIDGNFVVGTGPFTAGKFDVHVVGAIDHDNAPA